MWVAHDLKYEFIAIIYSVFCDINIVDLLVLFCYYVSNCKQTSVRLWPKWVYRFWPEVRGQSSKRAEVKPGDDSKLALLKHLGLFFERGSNLSYVLLCLLLQTAHLN